MDDPVEVAAEALSIARRRADHPHIGRRITPEQRQMARVAIEALGIERYDDGDDSFPLFRLRGIEDATP